MLRPILLSLHLLTLMGVGSSLSLPPDLSLVNSSLPLDPSSPINTSTTNLTAPSSEPLEKALTDLGEYVIRPLEEQYLSKYDKENRPVLYRVTTLGWYGTKTKEAFKQEMGIEIYYRWFGSYLPDGTPGPKTEAAKNWEIRLTRIYRESGRVMSLSQKQTLTAEGLQATDFKWTQQSVPLRLAQVVKIVQRDVEMPPSLRERTEIKVPSEELRRKYDLETKPYWIVEDRPLDRPSKDYVVDMKTQKVVATISISSGHDSTLNTDMKQLRHERDGRSSRL